MARASSRAGLLVVAQARSNAQSSMLGTASAIATARVPARRFSVRSMVVRPTVRPSAAIGLGHRARRGYDTSTMTSRVPAYEARLSVQGDERAFNEDGVDLTQIRRFLALTPLERLVWAEQAAAELEALRSIARVKISAHGKR
jgi:hypothetical protein